MYRACAISLCRVSFKPCQGLAHASSGTQLYSTNVCFRSVVLEKGVRKGAAEGGVVEALLSCRARCLTPTPHPHLTHTHGLLPVHLYLTSPASPVTPAHRRRAPPSSPGCWRPPGRGCPPPRRHPHSHGRSAPPTGCRGRGAARRCRQGRLLGYSRCGWLAGAWCMVHAACCTTVTTLSLQVVVLVQGLPVPW